MKRPKVPTQGLDGTRDTLGYLIKLGAYAEYLEEETKHLKIKTVLLEKRKEQLEKENAELKDEMKLMEKDHEIELDNQYHDITER